MTLGLIPRHSVFDATFDLVERRAVADTAVLSDPRHYNIRWIELLHELRPSFERFQTVT